ncbi:hypothetical protein BDV39DRAFT_175869 [Aspergillus sergii]|uniref:Uncharacterized protein n=1 Tax=Aspergillus sergii TaxID=1034303 RepID=A0A5N6X482_9EURO|nr:hypothetical protein BDV39DRAFT_175869 [Aspergillus sergii]
MSLFVAAERDAVFTMLKLMLSFIPQSRSSAKEDRAFRWMVNWPLLEYRKVRQD